MHGHDRTLEMGVDQCARPKETQSIEGEHYLKIMSSRSWNVTFTASGSWGVTKNLKIQLAMGWLPV